MTDVINWRSIEYVKDRQIALDKASQLFTTKAEALQKKNPEESQIALNFSAIYDNLATIYNICEMSMESINLLAKTLDELPDRQEFESLRKVLKGHEKKIKETLIPIKKKIDEQNNKDERGNPATG